jgi:hypothetical protein
MNFRLCISYGLKLGFVDESNRSAGIGVFMLAAINR